MKNNLAHRVSFCLFTFAFCLVLGVNAQNLTVQQIMAEPSIAGQRVEGEKLSPDGTKVIYLWNAEGKLPRDLYLSPTDRSDPKIILRVSDLPKPTASPTPENKLTYGLTVRDDFVKARENALGNFEWSPDSKKILFTQAGDIYVLSVGPSILSEQKDAKWATLETAIRRRSILLRDLIETYGHSVIDTEFIPWLKKQQKDLEVSMQSGGNWESQRQIVLQIDRRIQLGVDRFLLSGVPDQLKSNETFVKLVDELSGVQNRIKVARSDYEALVQDPKPKRYTKTQSPEVGARFLDNNRILYQQNGNLFVLNTADATTVQLTKEANPTTFISVTSATPNKEGSLVAYVVSDSSKQKALFVPNYLDEFVQAPTVRRGWSEQKVMVIPADGSRDMPFEIKLPKSEGMSNFRRMAWAADGRSLIVDRNDKDTKRRQLYYIHNVGSKDEQTILVTEETDDKWQASLSVIFEPNPKDAGQLFFCSEKDGYNHIYLATLERQKAEPNPTGEIRGEGEPGYTPNVAIKQLTKGNWQVEWAQWVPTGEWIAYMSTERGPSTRTFAVISREGTKGDLGSLGTNTRPIGMIESPQMATSANTPAPRIIFGASKWNEPSELMSQILCMGCIEAESGSEAIPLTRTVPDPFSKRTWNEPKFIDIPARDGKQIKSKIYLPMGFDNKKKYPMVIFVHGAGYLQNTINGWNNYYREFMFNELLTQKGYVVLDIDYRGSAGYGRDWRTDVYDFLGGKDYEDHLDAMDLMVKNYAVNPSKIGVYGGSYGGFMAEMLAFRASDKIAAAAALRPVADWKNYYASSPVYTAQRLGFPDKNPEAYKRSSPISYADGLKTQLLILHGVVDDNVPVEDSMQLTEKLIRLGKTEYFSEQFYPSENHGFVRPESWTDEYSRILAFFEKNLK